MILVKNKNYLSVILNYLPIILNYLSISFINEKYFIQTYFMPHYYLYLLKNL